MEQDYNAWLYKIYCYIAKQERNIDNYIEDWDYYSSFYAPIWGKIELMLKINIPLTLYYGHDFPKIRKIHYKEAQAVAHMLFRSGMLVPCQCPTCHKLFVPGDHVIKESNSNRYQCQECFYKTEILNFPYFFETIFDAVPFKLLNQIQSELNLDVRQETGSNQRKDFIKTLKENYSLKKILDSLEPKTVEYLFRYLLSLRNYGEIPEDGKQTVRIHVGDKFKEYRGKENQN